MSLAATRLPAARSSQRPSREGGAALHLIVCAAATEARSMSCYAVDPRRATRTSHRRRPLIDTTTAGRSRTQPTLAINSP